MEPFLQPLDWGRSSRVMTVALHLQGVIVRIIDVTLGLQAIIVRVMTVTVGLFVNAPAMKTVRPVRLSRYVDGFIKPC